MMKLTEVEHVHDSKALPNWSMVLQNQIKK
jgi:hypothetical protein